MTCSALNAVKGGISAVPKLAQSQRNSFICESFSSEGVTRAASNIERPGTWIFPPRGKGWSVFDLCFSFLICQHAQIQKQCLALKCSINTCSIEFKLVSEISFLLYVKCTLYIRQNQKKKKVRWWSRSNICPLVGRPRSSANFCHAPCPWWAKLP